MIYYPLVLNGDCIAFTFGLRLKFIQLPSKLSVPILDRTQNGQFKAIFSNSRTAFGIIIDNRLCSRRVMITIESYDRQNSYVIASEELLVLTSYGIYGNAPFVFDSYEDSSICISVFVEELPENMYTIDIHYDDTVIPLQISDNDSIYEMKRYIEEQYGYLVEEQRLFVTLKSGGTKIECNNCYIAQFYKLLDNILTLIVKPLDTADVGHSGFQHKNQHATVPIDAIRHEYITESQLGQMPNAVQPENNEEPNDNAIEVIYNDSDEYDSNNYTEESDTESGRIILDSDGYVAMDRMRICRAQSGKCK